MIGLLEETLRTVSESTRSVAAHNLGLEAELVEISAGLADRGVPFVVLKGVPLLRRLSLPLGDRRLADNDILVKKADVIRAAASLAEIGYAPDSHRPLGDDQTWTVEHKMYRTQRGRRWMAELHWNAFHLPFSGVSEQLVWSETEMVTLGTIDVRMMNPELTVIHTAAHYAWHFFAQPRLLFLLAHMWNQWRPCLRQRHLEWLADQTATATALDFALSSACTLGLVREPPPWRSPQARALSRLIPPAALLVRGSQIDYRRMVLSLLVAPPRGALRLAGSWARPAPARLRAGAAGDAAPERALALLRLRRLLGAISGARQR